MLPWWALIATGFPLFLIGYIAGQAGGRAATLMELMQQQKAAVQQPQAEMEALANALHSPAAQRP